MGVMATSVLLDDAKEDVVDGRCLDKGGGGGRTTFDDTKGGDRGYCGAALSLLLQLMIAGAGAMGLRGYGVRESTVPETTMMMIQM